MSKSNDLRMKMAQQSPNAAFQVAFGVNTCTCFVMPVCHRNTHRGVPIMNTSSRTLMCVFVFVGVGGVQYFCLFFEQKVFVKCTSRM